MHTFNLICNKHKDQFCKLLDLLENRTGQRSRSPAANRYEIRPKTVVYPMKYCVVYICFWCAAVTYSQEIGKYKSIRQIKMDLFGYWEKTSENQNGNKYLVEEINGQLYLNMGKFQRGGLEFSVLDKIFMEIVAGQTIKLKNFILENGGISELIFLDSKKLILRNGGKLFEFKRME